MNEMNITKIQKELFGLWKRIEDVFGRILSRWNLSENLFSTLYYLRETPDGHEPSQLAEMVGVQRQMMTIILNDLEGRGFILRREQKADRRRKRILLSKAGQRFSEEVLHVVNKIDYRALSAFTESERAQFLEFNRRYYCALRDSAVAITDGTPNPLDEK